MKTQNAVASSWLEVDIIGLRRTLERKGKAWAIFELVQNSWDTDATRFDAYDLNLLRAFTLREHLLVAAEAVNEIRHRAEIAASSQNIFEGQFSSILRRLRAVMQE